MIGELDLVPGLVVLAVVLVLAGLAALIAYREARWRELARADLYARCQDAQRRLGVPADLVFARCDRTLEDPDDAAAAIIEEARLGRVFDVAVARARLLARYPDLVHVLPPDVP